MNVFTAYLFFLALLFVGAITECNNEQSTAPTVSPPATDTASHHSLECDTLPSGLLDCPDLRPPGSPNKDSPIVDLPGGMVAYRAVGPQAFGAWSWSEGTGTLILCPHYAKFLSDLILLEKTEMGKERVVKAHSSSSHLHHERISAELSLR